MKQVTNTETVRKDLPEGWEAIDYERSDGAGVCRHCDLNPGWEAWPPNSELPFNEIFDTAEEAIAALDREHPMEKQHGEK